MKGSFCRRAAARCRAAVALDQLRFQEQRLGSLWVVTICIARVCAIIAAAFGLARDLGVGVAGAQRRALPT